MTNLNKKEKKRIIDSNNLGSVYNYVNKNIENRSNVDTLIDSAGKPVFDDTEKSDVLNSYFCSTGTDDDGASFKR